MTPTASTEIIAQSRCHAWFQGCAAKPTPPAASAAKALEPAATQPRRPLEITHFRSALVFPRAVLFDFDGVLADTENIHTVAWERTFAALGWEIPADTCARAAEQDDRAFAHDVFASRGLNHADLDGWVARKQQLARTLLADAPNIYHGAPELLQALHARGIMIGVVSSTWRENIAIVLGTRKLMHYFRCVVSKEDVSRIKPAPDAYQLALARLEIAAPDAVALEDSPSGVLSAVAAGVRCLAVGHRRPQGSWHGPVPYLPSLIDLNSVLSAIEST